MHALYAPHITIQSAIIHIGGDCRQNISITKFATSSQQFTGIDHLESVLLQKFCKKGPFSSEYKAMNKNSSQYSTIVIKPNYRMEVPTKFRNLRAALLDSPKVFCVPYAMKHDINFLEKRRRLWSRPAAKNCSDESSL